MPVRCWSGSRGGETTRALSPAFARRALALPHLQAPEVAPDLARIDLAAREMHVRRGDQMALVAGQRHPLGEDVVAVRKARAAVGARLVGERDAVLVQQRAGLRQGGGERALGGGG